MVFENIAGKENHGRSNNFFLLFLKCKRKKLSFGYLDLLSLHNYAFSLDKSMILSFSRELKAWKEKVMKTSFKNQEYFA